MISFICPLYNELEYIESLISFFDSCSFTDKEIFFIDGGSTDGTISIIKEQVKLNKNVYLLHNQKRYVPFALNIGIKASKGNPIIRLDAHTEYSEDYCDKILEVFNETDADIVGGPMIKAGKNFFQTAVAYCTSTILGIGDSKIHQFNYDGLSDHVYLGAWKREIFNDIGYFDERLIRNQDDEFHYRARSKGKKIFLSSKIKSKYFPRKNIKKLFLQYFQYGLFKPFVLKKIKSEIKLRHVIPSMFVLYLITFPFWIHNLVFSSLLIIYLILVAIFSLKSGLSLKSKWLSFFIYPTIHISYGFGFILGGILDQKIIKKFFFE